MAVFEELNTRQRMQDPEKRKSEPIRRAATPKRVKKVKRSSMSVTSMRILLITVGTLIGVGAVGAIVWGASFLVNGYISG